MCAFVCVCVCLCVFACVCVVCVHNTRICTHEHTHTHTHQSYIIEYTLIVAEASNLNFSCSRISRRCSSFFCTASFLPGKEHINQCQILSHTSESWSRVHLHEKERYRTLSIERLKILSVSFFDLYLPVYIVSVYIYIFIHTSLSPYVYVYIHLCIEGCSETERYLSIYICIYICKQ